MGVGEARTQGAFVAVFYGRDRGRCIAAPSAARRHRLYFAKPSYRFARFRSRKSRFAGRSPSLRIRYGYHSGP